MVRIDGLRCHIESPFVTNRVSIERKGLTEFGNVVRALYLVYLCVRRLEVGGLRKENTRKKYKETQQVVQMKSSTVQYCFLVKLFAVRSNVGQIPQNTYMLLLHVVGCLCFQNKVIAE